MWVAIHGDCCLRECGPMWVAIHGDCCLRECGGFVVAEPFVGLKPDPR